MSVRYYMVNSDLKLERKLWSEGNIIVIGVDEAGRGPWAGPVVAGAVCYRSETEETLELKDSKKLIEKRREGLFEKIKEEAYGYGVGVVSAEQIDQIGIQYAVQNAMLNAVHQVEQMVHSTADILIIDGSNVLDVAEYKQMKIIKGDAYHYSISAAAILAKVTRDRMMIRMDEQYPEYEFSKHKGYGTKVHKERLEKYGPCREHRLTYKPVRQVVEKFSYSR